ncbi:putative NACHT domain-containing protein [Seiridium cardinale]
MRTGWVYVCALYIAFEALNDPAMLCSCVALLAPTLVDFFSSDDQRLGDKRSLEQSVHNITPIAIDALYDDPLSKYTIAERISWGRGRQTTRGEDKVDALLGIINATIGANHGEGEEGVQETPSRNSG